MDIIKRVGLEGLDECMKNSDSEAQCCGKFKLRAGPGSSNSNLKVSPLTGVVKRFKTVISIEPLFS